LIVLDSTKDLGSPNSSWHFPKRGLGYRRCRLIWVNRDQIGVSFINHARAPKRTDQHGKQA